MSGCSGGAVREEDGDSIDDGIAAVTAKAADSREFERERLVAGRADEPLDIFRREWSYAHPSILARVRAARKRAARYHDVNEKYSSDFGWRCNCWAD